MMKQAWESFAIQGEITNCLSDILQRLIEVDLHCMVKNYDKRQPEEKSSHEIITPLLKLMTKRKKIEEILILSRPDEFKLFQELMDKDFKDIDDMPFEDYAYLMEYGIVFSFYDKERRYLLIPDEIKNTYSIINRSALESIRKKNAAIYRYIKSLCNFYGAFNSKQFVDIYNSYELQCLSIAEFKKILSGLVSRSQPFFDYGDYILDEDFFQSSLDEIDLFLEKIDGKPYYVPPREELLEKEADLDFKMMPQLMALREHIIHNICKDEKIVDKLIENIELLCFFKQPFEDVIYEFKRNNILFESKKHIKDLTPFLADVYNNTRTWDHRGYTAIELNRLFKEDIPLIIDLPIENLDDSIFKKIRRNDPCPCGSGRKYKKCCGR